MSNPPESGLPPEVILPSLSLQSLLASTGVREFVICAGARNSALLVMLAAVPGVRLWHHFEERSAAFFALGRILDHERPVAVVTTSGTAVAELLPAVIEAHYQGLPLIALTADRPANYRGTGAPQAIEQAGIFGCYPRLALDVTDLDSAPEALAPLINWDFLGPLHVNLCLEEPSAAHLPILRMAGHSLLLRRSKPNPPPPDSSTRATVDTGAYQSPLLLIGDLLPSERDAVAAFALTFQAPVYAEAASGLRESPDLHPWLIAGGDQALAKVQHDSVIRLGGVPTCRFWRDLENRPEIPVLNYSRSGHSGLARASAVVSLENCRISRDSIRFSLESRDSIRRPDRGYLTDHLEAYPASEPALVRALSKIIPADAVMFTGNSLAIREWNLCAQPPHTIHARALRGANGIDGNLSAFLGLAADAEEAWCLVGDLTALYDLAALWMLAQLATPRLRIVVMQNAGGKIFSRLPSLAGLTDFERGIMENPHGISLEGWAQMWGMGHQSWQGSVPALTDPADLPDRCVIEIHPDAGATEVFWKALAGQA